MIFLIIFQEKTNKYMFPLYCKTRCISNYKPYIVLHYDIHKFNVKYFQLQQ